ncbi:MAG: tetratricopeptide repeat protein [Chloroflexi bacterium]|nr:MAG: tetratricopeptide repeat protein [Chloroflexota bacterium]
MRLPRLRGRQGDAARRLDLAALALEDGDPRKALDLAGSALSEARRRGAESEVLEALLLRAASLFELERFAEARKEAAQACEADPENPAAWFERAEAAYRCADFEEALSAVRTAVDLDPEDPEGWNLLGRVALWMDAAPAAEEAFRRAAKLDAEEYVVPVRIAAGEFDRTAAQVWATIPAAFQARLSNALVVVEPLPDPDDVARGFDPDTLGIYEGGTALADDWPERIVLFQRNHENVCGSLGALREEIRRTVLHEVGHHFGMDEHELPY